MVASNKEILDIIIPATKTFIPIDIKNLISIGYMGMNVKLLCNGYLVKL